jgi:hypothetical protein
MFANKYSLNEAEKKRWTPAMQIILNHLAKRKNERTKILQSLVIQYIKYDQDILKILKYMEQERMIEGIKDEYGWVWSLAGPVE